MSDLTETFRTEIGTMAPWMDPTEVRRWAERLAAKVPRGGPVHWERLAMVMDEVEEEDAKQGVVGRGRKIDRVAIAYQNASKHDAEDEPHFYDIVCRVCGQPGQVRISVDPNFPDAALVQKVEDEFH